MIICVFNREVTRSTSLDKGNTLRSKRTRVATVLLAHLSEGASLVVTDAVVAYIQKDIEQF